MPPRALFGRVITQIRTVCPSDAVARYGVSLTLAILLGICVGNATVDKSSGLWACSGLGAFIGIQ